MLKSGSTRLTADGAVGISGQPIWVYNVTWRSGGSAGEVLLRNGSDATGDAYVEQDGTANKTVTLNFENGLYFPGGCFFDKDTNVDAVVVGYSQAVA